MLYANGLTDKARGEWREWLAARVGGDDDDDRLVVAMLAQIESADVYPDIGARVEIPGRWARDGRPNDFAIPASDFVWLDDGEGDTP